MIADDHRLLVSQRSLIGVDGQSQSGNQPGEVCRHTLHKPMISCPRNSVATVNKEEQPRVGIDHEQHDHTEIQETDYRSPVHIDVAEQQCSDAEEAVKNTDTRKVACRHKMADTFLLRRIIDAYGHRYKRHIVPRGKHEQFEFRLIAAGEDPQSVELMQRIQSHAGLRVRQMNSRLQGKPEVGEPVGELAFAGHIVVSKLPAAHNQRIRVHIVRA